MVQIPNLFIVDLIEIGTFFKFFETGVPMMTV
jgi:hypothetical protein